MANTSSHVVRRRLWPPNGWSLRARLALLVIVSILPLLALGLTVQYMRYLDDRAATGQRALEVARGAASIVGRELEADIRALEVLAQHPSLRTGDFERFRLEAQALAEEFLSGAVILLVREDGRQLVNTALPSVAALPQREHLENTHEVLTTGRPRVSDVYKATLVDSPVVGIDVPVRDMDGNVRYTLTLSPSPAVFSRIVDAQARPGYITTLADRRGTIIARTPNGDRYVGRPMGSDVVAALASDSEGTLDTKSLEGVSVLTGFTHVEPFGWVAVVGIPHSKYMGPVLQSAALMVGAVVFVLLIALLLARSVARQITGPIAQLRAFTSLPRGTATVPMKTGLPEADELADAMAGYISERNAAEQKLTELNEGLEQRIAEAVAERDSVQARLAQAQKMEAMGQLTGGIAHDFNNLLTAVIGNLELVLRNASKDSRIAKFADHALQAAGRGATLVSQLLAFGRRQVLAPQPLRIDEAVADIRALIQRAAGESVQVEIETDPHLWPCLVDKAQFESAILNLVINARDAMSNGGVVTVVARNQIIGGGPASVLDVPAGEYVRTAVSDTGTGMSAEVAAQAFDPFFTTKAVGKGTGLGLSQVYGFARQSGGTAVIESVPGHGTTVALILPRSAGTSTPKDVAEVASPQADTGHHVLVVEDQAEVRDLAEVILRDLGYRTTAAESAESALDVIRDDPSVEVVFSDVVLGGAIDGAELAAVAREMRPELKVLLTSGYPDRMNRGRLGGVDFLRKPYRRDDLAHAFYGLFHSRVGLIGAVFLSSGIG